MYKKADSTKEVIHCATDDRRWPLCRWSTGKRYEMNGNPRPSVLQNWLKSMSLEMLPFAVGRYREKWQWSDATQRVTKKKSVATKKKSRRVPKGHTYAKGNRATRIRRTLFHNGTLPLLS